MSIVPMTELLQRAIHGGYAVGYYESWDVYSFEAVLEAAEECRSPAILGFGGAVVNQPWLDGNGVEELTSLARCLAERSQVPTAVLFNEARTFKQVLRGLVAGCNVVMLDTSHLSYDENALRTAKVVEAAHSVHAAVEAELGHLADGSDPTVQARGTDPIEAARFVSSTGVDALAVSIGNVHILARGEAFIDLQLLAAIHRAVAVPLVIHGGTGFPAAAVRAAIERGVAKFNVGTRLKSVYLAGIRSALAAMPDQPNVHDVIGSRDEGDVINQAKLSLKNEIKRFMQLYSSTGQASHW